MIGLPLTALIAYLLGSIPFGYLIAKRYGIDITKFGSGGIGTTNVYRALGPGPAAIVAFCDLMKGAFSAFIGYILVPQPYSLLGAMIGAMFAVIGAVNSIFLGLKGGRGIATFVGGYLFLASITNTWGPLAASLPAWITTLLLTRIISLANLVTLTVLVPIHAMVTTTPEQAIVTTYVVFGLVAASVALHENIKRLLEGKERTIDRVKR